MKKLKMRKNYKYGVDKSFGEDMKQGTMTNTEYDIGNGVTMILVAEGWLADQAIDAKVDEINALIEGK